MADKKHWLVRPETIAKLWRWGLILLALTVAAELTYEAHPYFTIDGLPGFHAAYGLLACVAMIFGAKLLAVFLKRADDYYAADAAEAEEALPREEDR